MSKPRSAKADALALALVAALALVVSWRMQGMSGYSDERFHMRQIRAFCAGDWRIDGKLTVLPGYHLLSAAVGVALHDCSRAAMRRLDALIGVLSAAAFLFAARATPGTRPGLRTLGYFLLPVVLPYHFLVYSDTSSLLAILLGVGMLLRGRYVAAGLILDMSLLLRQSNVVWLLLPVAFSLHDGRERRPAALLRRLWPCALGLAAFGAFVVWNRGVAVGDRGAHHAGIYPGNVFFALLLAAGIFLPRALRVAWSARRRLSSPGALLLGALLAVAFVWGFGVPHPYNRFEGFLRNELLMAAEASLALRVALAAPLLLGAALFAAERLARPVYALYYPLALLSLVPMQIVEQRYAFVALVLYQLFRRDDPLWLEGASLAWSAALSALLVEGLARGAFLL